MSSFSDIQALVEDLSGSNPRDPSEQAGLLKRIRDYQAMMDRARAPELAAYLDTAGLLTEHLCNMGGLGPEEILVIITRLVKQVDSAFHLNALEQAPLPETENASEVKEETAISPGGLNLMPTARVPGVGAVGIARAKLLGEIMIQLRRISSEQLEEALSVQRVTGMRMGEALVKIGAAGWDDVQSAIRIQNQLKLNN